MTIEIGCDGSNEEDEKKKGESDPTKGMECEWSIKECNKEIVISREGKKNEWIRHSFQVERFVWVRKNKSNAQREGSDEL